MGGRYGQTRDGAAELRREPGQLTIPAEFMSDINTHSFWKRGNIGVFDQPRCRLLPVHDIQKALAKEEENMKEKYL